ncbi:MULTISPECIES: hypothetical protein [unclassified Clostridium]|uniref:hypothetical protein n=1 Tax=unclassified Clostridium TaxID=2614128 RepID=UPI0020797F16|nr:MULTISPECIES: hypothetical protein [unclassified Clostridium]
MRRKTIENAKFIVRVESNKGEKSIKTVSIFDNRIKEYLKEDYIQERNVESFLDINDLKETLNWNLNGNSLKCQLKWGMTGRCKSEGIAYIFD